MKKIFFIYLTFLLIGCANYNKFLNKNIPALNCDEFTFHENIVGSVGDIYAQKLVIKDNKLSIGFIKVSHDFGPFSNGFMILKNYSREIPK